MRLYLFLYKEFDHCSLSLFELDIMQGFGHFLSNIKVNNFVFNNALVAVLPTFATYTLLTG